MKTQIDNTQIKFYIHEIGWSSENYVCNLKDIPKVIKTIADKEPYKIYQIWNHKLAPISKQELDEMFEANQINFRFIEPKYKVVKIGRASGRRLTLEKNLTESEAQRYVQGVPNSQKSMVVYTKQ